MKRLLLALLLVVVMSPATVHAAHFWQIKMSTPSSAQSSKNFNVEFTTLSVDGSDSIDVELLQDGNPVGTKTVTGNGDSGAFAVSVPADGTYAFRLRATNSNGGEVKLTDAVNVSVDTVSPPAAVYDGVVRDGNTYTVTFTVPASSDIARAKMYASTSSNFTANAATQIADLAVTAGQQISFTYTAPDSARRFFAVRLFDTAGNASSFVGDTTTVVTPGAAAGEDTGTFADGSAAGQVAAGQSGTVDDAASSIEIKEPEDPPAPKVQNDWTWLIVLSVAILLGGVYYWINNDPFRAPKK